MEYDQLVARLKDLSMISFVEIDKHHDISSAELKKAYLNDLQDALVQVDHLLANLNEDRGRDRKQKARGYEEGAHLLRLAQKVEQRLKDGR